MCLSIASEIVKSIVTASQVKSTARHVDIIQGISLTKSKAKLFFSAQIYSLHGPVVTIDWTAITKSGTTAVLKPHILILLQTICHRASMRATISKRRQAPAAQPNGHINGIKQR